MSGPFDINGLGANYFTTLQSTILIAGGGATYSAAFTSSATSISAALTQLCDLDTPAGLSRVLLAATLSGLETTSNQLDVEIEVDGVVVLKTAASNPIGISNVYILGGNSAQTPVGVNAIQVDSNLKIRARKPLSTGAILTLWYVDRG
jgi:hypothetical protein